MNQRNKIQIVAAEKDDVDVQSKTILTLTMKATKLDLYSVVKELDRKR